MKVVVAIVIILIVGAAAYFVGNLIAEHGALSYIGGALR